MLWALEEMQVPFELVGMDTAYKAEGLAGRTFLVMRRGEQALAWRIIPPSALFAPGEGISLFRLRGDALLSHAEGKSHISMEDFAIAIAIAIAMVDEVEQPAHSRQRFQVGNYGWTGACPAPSKSLVPRGAAALS